MQYAYHHVSSCFSESIRYVFVVSRFIAPCSIEGSLSKHLNILDSIANAHNVKIDGLCPDGAHIFEGHCLGAAAVCTRN